MRRHTKLKKKLAFSKNMHMHLRVNLEEDLVEVAAAIRRLQTASERHNSIDSVDTAFSGGSVDLGSPRPGPSAAVFMGCDSETDAPDNNVTFEPR